MGRTCLSPDLKSRIGSVAFCFSSFALDVGMLVEFVQQKSVPFFVCGCCSVDVAAGGELRDNG